MQCILAARTHGTRHQHSDVTISNPPCASTWMLAVLDMKAQTSLVYRTPVLLHSLRSYPTLQTTTLPVLPVFVSKGLRGPTREMPASPGIRAPLGRSSVPASFAEKHPHQPSPAAPTTRPDPGREWIPPTAAATKPAAVLRQGRRSTASSQAGEHQKRRSGAEASVRPMGHRGSVHPLPRARLAGLGKGAAAILREVIPSTGLEGSKHYSM